jgi:hypothetical protein
MTPSEVYAEMLKAEGLLVEGGSDGRLRFKYEGDRYELLTYADDLQYVGISATYRIPAGVRRSRTLAEANDLTRRSKVVKVYVIPSRGDHRGRIVRPRPRATRYGSSATASPRASCGSRILRSIGGRCAGPGVVSAAPRASHIS